MVFPNVVPSTRLVTSQRNVTASCTGQLGSISTSLLRHPLQPLHVHSQIYPLLDQFLQPFVIGNLFPHRADLIRPNKEAAALAAPSIAELVVRPMLLWIRRILAAASRRSTDIVLLADAAGVQRSELEKRALDLGYTFLRIVLYHADSMTQLSVIVHKKSIFTLLLLCFLNAVPFFRSQTEVGSRLRPCTH